MSHLLPLRRHLKKAQGEFSKYGQQLLFYLENCFENLWSNVAVWWWDNIYGRNATMIFVLRQGVLSNVHPSLSYVGLVLDC